MSTTIITVSADIAASPATVWEAYNNPEDIKQWNQASPDWHCPSSENDLREGGRFRNTMAAKDGSFSFDFSGVYTRIVPYKLVEYTLDDNRRVSVNFVETEKGATITTSFEAEDQHPVDLQREGWQLILNSFKNHTEHNH